MGKRLVSMEDGVGCENTMHERMKTISLGDGNERDMTNVNKDFGEERLETWKERPWHDMTCP